MKDVEVNRLPPGTPSETKRKALHAARFVVRRHLKALADWLKSADAPAAEVDALRTAYKAIPDPKA